MASSVLVDCVYCKIAYHLVIDVLQIGTDDSARLGTLARLGILARSVRFVATVDVSMENDLVWQIHFASFGYPVLDCFVSPALASSLSVGDVRAMKDRFLCGCIRFE